MEEVCGVLFMFCVPYLLSYETSIVGSVLLIVFWRRWELMPRPPRLSQLTISSKTPEE